MRELNWDDLRVDDYHWEFDPVDEVWRNFNTGEEASDEVSSLLNYIQAITLPAQSSESLKFLADELKKTLTFRDLEIEKLRDKIEILETQKFGYNPALREHQMKKIKARRNYNSYNEME